MALNCDLKMTVEVVDCLRGWHLVARDYGCYAGIDPQKTGLAQNVSSAEAEKTLIWIKSNDI